MLESKVDDLWEQSVSECTDAIKKGEKHPGDPVKIFARKVGEYLASQVDDPDAQKQIQKLCGIKERKSYIVSLITGYTFYVKDAVLLNDECLTESEWMKFDCVMPEGKRKIAQEKGFPLPDLLY
jgi:hypothetical protein